MTTHGVCWHPDTRLMCFVFLPFPRSSMANTSLTFWAPYSSRLFFCPGRSAWPQTAKCLLLKLGQVKTSCYHILTLTHTHTDTLTIHFPPLDFYSIAMNLIYSRKNNFCCVGPSHHEALDPLPTAGVRESFFRQNYNREIRLDLSMGKGHPSSHAPVLAFPSPETCCSLYGTEGPVGNDSAHSNASAHRTTTIGHSPWDSGSSGSLVRHLGMPHPAQGQNEVLSAELLAL